MEKAKLTKLELTADEKQSIPFGFAEIYAQPISTSLAEERATVYNRKYSKADLFALSSEKPISKI